MSNYEVVRPVHYLGSKLRMLDSIREAADEIEPKGGKFLDLFSGSGTVSKYMLGYRNVISSDIQEYSGVLCEASMSSLNEKPPISDIMDEIYNSNVCRSIHDLFFPILSYEQKCLNDAILGNYENLYEIIEKGSFYIFLHESEKNLSYDLDNCLHQVKKSLITHDLLESKDCMITRYFGGLYFSYQQAVRLDNIASIAFKYEGLLHIKMLAALLSTTSEIVNTVGKQFAQPLKVRNSKGDYKSSLVKKIIRDRSLDVFSIYEKWLSYYLNIKKPDHDYSIIKSDYLKALDSIVDKDVSVIYADPPYTRYHYSRYYHVLESICLRDNPKVSTKFPNGKGGISRAIYREDRHQSPFCIKSKAEGAFESLFRKTSDMQVPLILSYSPFNQSNAVTPRLRTIDQLLDMAHSYYRTVYVKSPGEFTHSKLNSSEKNFETNHQAELLILCR